MSYSINCGDSGGCGYSSNGGSAGYSTRDSENTENYGLEGVLGKYSGSSGGGNVYSGNDISYMIAAEPAQFRSSGFYDFDNVKKEVYSDNYKTNKRISETYSHSVDDFLNPERPKTVFVGKANEIKEFVEETFFKLTGRDFPDDVVVRIVTDEEIKKMHPGNVLGFALNRKHLGLVSEIFVKNDMLDRLMITLGHELGHVLTRRLSDNKDEEAKAFAFSLAWMKKIKEENIANLSTSIQLDAPAKNGLHDVALDFVLGLINKGREAFDVWKDIVKGFVRVGAW
ncbi:hypothetical protein GOV06_02805 [Candidatus Woesearchaeota archaeon]|nr:hypothetical protein [Candidatus Woesearchaeota archaeon]